MGEKEEDRGIVLEERLIERLGSVQEGFKVTEWEE